MNIENMSLNEICIELDKLSVRMLQLMKDYIDVKVTIEDLIKDGCIHLAKSRYIMGNRNVSALQLPTEESSDINASTTVVCNEHNSDALTLELSRLNINDKGKGSDEDTVRQRLNIKNDSEAIDDTTKVVFQDPLKWFGVLVPQDMRRAQSNFNKAIEYIVQCTNIQLEIMSVEEKYKKYLSQKQQLVITSDV